MSTNPETTRALRRMFACAETGTIALRQVAETVDQPTAIALLNIADLLDGATQHGVAVLAHQPTDGDRMQAEAIRRQVGDLSRGTEASRVH